MASATATATMAASGFDKNRGVCTSSSLQTPGSGTFPSELRSPMAGSPGFLKREESLKTPITPPSAYLSFLKNLSPALMSPMSTSTSSRFNFNDKPMDRLSESSVDKSINSPASSHPNLSRNTSYESTTTTTSTSSAESFASHSSTASTGRTRPESPRITIPPSPFAKPAPRSARTPRRLQIPQSPFSPAVGSAHSIPSPYAQTPLSATPWSATYSPHDVDPEINGKPGKVSVRQVVTRTVTYCRTPLEPAPRGKRRKLGQAENDTPSFAMPQAKSKGEKQTLGQVIDEPVAVKSEPVDESSQISAGNGSS